MLNRRITRMLVICTLAVAILAVPAVSNALENTDTS